MEATVLIVDDDPGAAEAFGPTLKSQGYHVQVADDAESGLNEVERSAPVAIILDLHLPTIDGVEFLRRLRSLACHSDVPVAVVTGDYLVDDDVTSQLLAMGAQLFFKPLWEDDSTKIVRDLVSSGSCSCDHARG